MSPVSSQNISQEKPKPASYGTITLFKFYIYFVTELARPPLSPLLNPTYTHSSDSFPHTLTHSLGADLLQEGIQMLALVL